MRNKILLFLISIGIALLLAACSGDIATPSQEFDTSENSEIPAAAVTSEGSTITQKEVIYYGFTKAVSVSDSILVGEYISRDVEDWGGIVYSFKVKEVWRGEVSEEMIHLVSDRGETHVIDTGGRYEIGGDIYQKGTEYILIMQRHDSLFYEYPQYTVIGDIFIPVEDFSKSTMYGEPLAEHTDEEIKDIKALYDFIQGSALRKKKTQNFTWSTDLPTVVSEADLILKVKITEVIIEGTVQSSHLYGCDVIEFVKGDSFVTFEEGHGDIGAALMQGLEIGETYLVMINRVDETALFYKQSSPVSIVSLSDEKTIAEIYNLVKNG